MLNGAGLGLGGLEAFEKGQKSVHRLVGRDFKPVRLSPGKLLPIEAGREDAPDAGGDGREVPFA